MIELTYKYQFLKRGVSYLLERNRLNKVYEKFHDFTMIPREDFLKNLSLSKNAKYVEGAVVECGVWRGGMIAGMAFLLGANKDYYLFDSFEGLPPVKPIDGVEAKQWQADKESPGYCDNCKAEIDFAQRAMKLAVVDEDRVFFIKGWFNETLIEKNFDEKISLLRLDADWYESTMNCLEFFFPKVVPGGLIIIDDYYVWEGCTKAVHDYLSKNARPERIEQFENRIAYIIKK
jgi:O-methyltransferase